MIFKAQRIKKISYQFDLNDKMLMSAVKKNEKFIMNSKNVNYYEIKYEVPRNDKTSIMHDFTTKSGINIWIVGMEVVLCILNIRILACKILDWLQWASTSFQFFPFFFQQILGDSDSLHIHIVKTSWE